MTTSRKMQSALRAALKNEDAALAQRLPDMETTQPAVAKPAAAKRTSTKPATTQPASTQPAPKKSDATLLPPPAPVVVAPEPLPAESPAKPAKPEKRVRETFSLSRGDIDRLSALKARAQKHGLKCGRSALLRAALLLLEGQDAARVSALVEQLPAFKKSKRKKK